MHVSKAKRFLSLLFMPYLPLIALLFVMLFPFYYMFITSFKTLREVFDFTTAPLWIVNPTLDNYVYLFTRLELGRWYWNSIVISVSTTVFSLILSIFAGYAIARLRFRGAALAGILIFITYLVPKTLLFIPLSQLLNSMGVLGKMPALILSYPTFLIPFCTWLLTGYFRTLPTEPEQSAMVDGCSRFGAMWRIALPMAWPGILTAAIFSFTLSWNELLYALVYISGEVHKTLPVGLINNLAQRDAFNWGPLMAGATIASLPVAILYFFFMDKYVSGLTAGAVKG